MVPAFPLEDIVRTARARTGVPGVAAGLWRDGESVLAADGVLELGRAGPVVPQTPFRVASISKPFTSSLALASLPLDAQLEAWLSHTSGWRCESRAPLPPDAQGLFSYSNAGYWAAGEAAAVAAGTSFETAMAERILSPLGLEATGYEEPAAPARGHVQAGTTGHRPVPHDAYPPARRPSGGLWSTVGDLLRFAAHHLGGPGPLAPEVRAAMREPRSRALGGGYALGWWRRELAGRETIEHEGSVAGYQSLLLLVPEERLALAVLTNSWRGSGLVRRVVEHLEAALAGGAPARPPRAASRVSPAGRYALDAVAAVVEARRGGLTVETVEIDPVTGARTAVRFPVRHLGDGVYGHSRGVLLGHRLDFPRRGLARIGWVVLPRAAA